MPKYENENDLKLETNQDAEQIDSSDRVVGQILRVIREWSPTLDRKLQENDMIDDVLEDTHTVVERDRNAPTPSYLLQSVRFKTRRRMQPPDWKIEAEGATNEELEFITRAAVQKMKE